MVGTANVTELEAQRHGTEASRKVSQAQGAQDRLPSDVRALFKVNAGAPHLKLGAKEDFRRAGLGKPRAVIKHADGTKPAFA
jgi:hypothetical protein